VQVRLPTRAYIRKASEQGVECFECRRRTSSWKTGGRITGLYTNLALFRSHSQLETSRTQECNNSLWCSTRGHHARIHHQMLASIFYYLPKLQRSKICSKLRNQWKVSSFNRDGSMPCKLVGSLPKPKDEKDGWTNTQPGQLDCQHPHSNFDLPWNWFELIFRDSSQNSCGPKMMFLPVAALQGSLSPCVEFLCQRE
jgi:hypothetical protein